MADVALQFVVETLVPIIIENWKLIGGAKEESAHLLGELNRLKAFLQDAAKYRQSNSEQWKYFIKEVQVMVYKAEGLIDKLLVKAKLHQEKNIIVQNLDAKYAKTVWDLAKEIRDALEQVKKIREENPEAFQAKPMLDDQPDIVAPGPQDSVLEENEVVGFDEEAKIVIDRLAEGTNDLDVIPVVGLAGLGKTTLAIKIYNDPKISYEFFKTIWVYVGPQQYKPKEVFLSILEGFTKRTTEYQNMAVSDLTNTIREFILKGGKCLIVLDDVWATDVVDSVMKVFPENSKGHRIMLTTRDLRIGRYANSEPHSLKYLTDKESFQLLEIRVFGSNIRKCPEDLIAYGENIAIQCNGLPLAVVVIAGALKGRTSERVWQMVKENVGKHLINKEDPKSCLKYVEMSYGHLPEDMKACFLYCGAFPQGFEIPAWKLIRLWISEGLINSNLDGKPEDIADFYLNELVNRNLVIVMQKRVDGQVKTCRLHDMLHQFCKMENGGLFKEVCEKTDQPGTLIIPDLDTSRRLCIQLSLLRAFISKGPSAEHVRSFLCFSTKQKESEQLGNIRLLHKAFPLVRVLDVESLNFTFSKDFQERFHLRYIAISGDYHALPPFFGRFWNLQTLIVNTKAPSIEIKADIWNMLRLRHLHTNVPAKLPPATQTTEESSCLQTLSKVAPGSCREDVLARACNLRKVSIQGEMADFLEINKGGFNNFRKLKCLEQLKLLNDVGMSKSKVLQLPPAFLEFLRKLKKLTLSNTKFVWSDANGLGRLECLQVLKLKENAFSGTAWDSEGFSQLKVLWIERADFTNWRASNRSFQRLKYLVLISCDKLEAVPFEFAGVSSLQEMTLENTKKANKSAKAIEGRKTKMQELMRKVAEKKSGTDSQAPESFKFKLTIFPPESADCETTE
ncbi:putative late blight resistance protein homolog R1A-3 [Nicotiana sylvestris]|uniref:putative late blight resistance protein homolog R1A-3 n=1 Tax=Nicotiana sylvestris TaxID=4096 RepID=UPI00388C6D98